MDVVYKPIKEIILISGIISLLLSSCKANSNILYDNSVCWEISKENEKCSYILGSIHSLDTTQITFPIDVIKELIDKCSHLSLESSTMSIDSAAMNKVLTQLIRSDASYNIKEKLGEEYYKKLLNIIDSSKTELKLFKPLISRLNPNILLFLVVGENQLGKSQFYRETNFSMDTYFESYAVSKNYNIYGLESPQNEWEVFLDTPLDETVQALKESMDNYFTEEAQSSHDIIKKYINNDLQLLDQESYTDTNMIRRNKNMAEGIHKIMQSNPVFVIIGAAHLPNQYGVLNLLKEKGYKIRPYPIVISQKE